MMGFAPASRIKINKELIVEKNAQSSITLHDLSVKKNSKNI